LKNVFEVLRALQKSADVAMIYGGGGMQQLVTPCARGIKSSASVSITYY
jgi:hypothetical protein